MIILSPRQVFTSLRKMCLYSELFWSAFSRIWTEYGEIRSISPYSVRMPKNADQNNSKYGLQKCAQDPAKHLGWSFLAKRINEVNSLTIFARKLPHRCLKQRCSFLLLTLNSFKVSNNIYIY